MEFSHIFLQTMIIALVMSAAIIMIDRFIFRRIRIKRLIFYGPYIFKTNNTGEITEISPEELPSEMKKGLEKIETVLKEKAIEKLRHNLKLSLSLRDIFISYIAITILLTILISLYITK